MSTLLVTIEDGKEESLKRILNEIPYVKNISDASSNLVNEENTQYQQIKKILDAAKGKELFKEIKDSSEWQRQLRKEWDRDF